MGPRTRIGRLRQMYGLTAVDFAQVLRAAGCVNMTPSRLAKIENGALCGTREEQDRIAQALNVARWEIFDR